VPGEQEAQQEAAEIQRIFKIAINYHNLNLHLGFKKREMLKLCALLGEEPKARESRSCRGLSHEEKHEGDLGTGGGCRSTREHGTELEPPPAPAFGSRKSYVASS